MAPKIKLDTVLLDHLYCKKKTLICDFFVRFEMKCHISTCIWQSVVSMGECAWQNVVSAMGGALA